MPGLTEFVAKATRCRARPDPNMPESPKLVAATSVGGPAVSFQSPTTLSMTTPWDGTVAVYCVAMEPRSV
jgi:hypothetical protein